MYGLQRRFDSYQLISTDEIIAEDPRFYTMKKRAIDWQAILLDWRRKLRAMHYSRYWKYLPEGIKLYLSDSDWKEQAKRVAQLLVLLVTNDMLDIDQNFYDLIGSSKEADTYDVYWNDYDVFLKSSNWEVAN